MKAGDVMCDRVEFIDANSSVLEAIETLIFKKVGAIVVKENGKPVGVVTVRDVVLRCLAKGLDPRDTKVGDVASKPIIAVSGDTPIEEVSKTLEEKNVGRVFVKENGSVIGYVSPIELMLAYLKKYMGEVVVIR